MKKGKKKVAKTKTKTKTKVKTKARARAKVKSRAKAKPRSKGGFLTVNTEKNEVFDEVEELRRIETCLDIIFGHLRRVKSEGGDSSLKLILDYFYSKYGTCFFSRQ